MDREDQESRLEHHRQMEALGQLAGGMAHDLNNLLSATLARLELVEEGLGEEVERVRDDLHEVRRNTVTGSRMVKHLLSFSRGDRLRVEPVPLEDVVVNAVELARSILPESISVEVTVDDPGPVLADASAVEKILLTLAARARDAMETGGRLEIQAGSGWLDPEHPKRTGWGEPGEYGVIAVTDMGRGMDPDTVKRLFQPFFDPEKGTGRPSPGVSMSMVYGLMKQHRGFIEVESQPESGTTVRLYFRLAGERAGAAAAAASEEVNGRRGTVLLVEDEESLLNVGGRILGAHGYRVLQAEDGFQALELVDREGVPDLLIIDLVMPSMSGIELIRRLEEEGRLPRVLVTSGFQPELFLEWHRDPSDFPFLEKPWTMEGLLDAVGNLLSEESE